MIYGTFSNARSSRIYVSSVILILLYPKIAQCIEKFFFAHIIVDYQRFNGQNGQIIAQFLHTFAHFCLNTIFRIRGNQDPGLPLVIIPLSHYREIKGDGIM
jgi:hypothetical protein